MQPHLKAQWALPGGVATFVIRNPLQGMKGLLHLHFSWTRVGGWKEAHSKMKGSQPKWKRITEYQEVKSCKQGYVVSAADFLVYQDFGKSRKHPFTELMREAVKASTCTRLRTPVNEAGAAGRGTAANLNAKPTFLTWHSTCCMVAGAVWTQRRASIQNRRNARRKGFEKWKYAG